MSAISSAEGGRSVYNIRCTSPQWRDVVDTRAGPRSITRETGFTPRSVASMLHWLGGGRSVVSWVRTLSWWRCIRKLVAMPGATVAGSAALFIEHLNATRDPGFAPSDIDVWVDPMTSIDELLQLTELSISTLDRHPRNETGKPFWSLPQNITRLLARGDIQIQIISQQASIPPLGGCECAILTESCRTCISMTHSTGYECARWNPGMPHLRFDLDVASVALRWQAHGLTTHRVAGDPTGDRMNILALGVWCLHDIDLPVVEVDRERLRRRLKKYRSRGFPRVTVAPRMLVPDTTGNRVYIDTPQWLCEECNNTMTA